MTRFHINHETGNAGKCSATQGKCPFGGETDHFTTEIRARKFFERRMQMTTTDPAVKRKRAALEEKEEWLNVLAVDEDNRTRSYVARNQHTSQAVLQKLAKDDEANVREEVARNSHTPADILTDLSADQDFSVVIKVAANENTPSYVIAKLMGSFDGFRKGVTYGNIAQNWSALPQVLTEIHEYLPEMKENRPFVEACLARNPNTPVNALRELNANTRWSHTIESLAENPSCPSDILEELATHPGSGYELKSRIVNNPGCTESLLARLSTDESKDIQSLVAQNPRTPLDTLREIAERGDRDTDWKAQGNPTYTKWRYPENRN